MKEKRTAKILRGIRFHAIATIYKMHGLGSFNKLSPYLLKYYQQTYPNKLCIFCKGHNQDLEEDTTHMMTCENRETRTQSATQTWHDIQRHSSSTDKRAPKTKCISPAPIYSYNKQPKRHPQPAMERNSQAQERTSPNSHTRAQGDGQHPRPNPKSPEDSTERTQNPTQAS